MNSCEEIDNICRICLLEDVDLRSIFKIGEVCGEFLTLSKMLTECISIESFPEDGLPQTLCMKCIKQLSKMYLFRKKCIKSHSILRERFHQQGDLKPVIIENQDQEEYMDTVYYVDEINTNANNNEYQEEQEGNNENTEEVKENCEYEVHEMEDISAYYHEPNNHHHHQQQETQSQQLQQQNSLDTETEITDNNVIFEEIDEGEDQNFEQIELYTVSDDENTTTLKIISTERDENYEVDHQNVIAISAGEDSISIKSGITVSGRGDGGVIDSDIATDSGTNDDRTDHRLSENENQYGVTKIRKYRKNKIPGPPFKCDKCGKILSNRSSYSYHQQLHSDNTPFVCDICGASFKTRNSHIGHMTTHNKFNPHTCKICGKSYRQASSLRSHMLTHTGEKPFVCNICGKGMTQKSGFKKHMLVHTGEKPFSCEFCGKKFRYSSNLIIHRNNHTKRVK